MQIEIKLDESCKEPNIIIHTDKMTEEVSQIVKLLSEEKPVLIRKFTPAKTGHTFYHISLRFCKISCHVKITYASRFHLFLVCISDFIIKRI